jgi:hypothetical protein
MERFFDLAVTGGGRAAGYVGQITANSFMKREFGKKLIEEFFAKVDLTHVIDTSGAYIPGHGTPTVILVGRARLPVDATVRAVLGIKGEPSTPADPSQGLVWQSIVHHVDQANALDSFTSVADIDRTAFTSHPWSIGGGGASDVKEVITKNCKTLEQYSESIGITCFTLEDDVYTLPAHAAKRAGIPDEHLREMVLGDSLRDWSATECEPAVFPYTSTFTPIDETSSSTLERLWPYRTNLSNNKMFGGKTKVETGLRWFEYGRLTDRKLRTPLSIAFAFVASHNHFVLERGGKVFNRSAPIIKLPPDATEDDHLGLLGLLNSSTACFWMQQTFHNKGGPGGGSSKDEKWHDFYEFSGTGLQRFPVTELRPTKLAAQLDKLASESSILTPGRNMSQRPVYTASQLSNSRVQSAKIHGQMIATQEELDWECYRLYGIVEEDLCYDGDLPTISVGERAFEIVMARQMARGEMQTKWFSWLQIKPVIDIPHHWPDGYRKLVKRRVEVIESNKDISLIEKPDCKRRWEFVPWEVQQQRALKNWLLDRLETTHYWPDPNQHEPRLQSVAELADKASGDHDFLQVAAIYRGREDFDVASLVAELVEAESVPFLPVLRYKPTGLRKRDVWEQTWELQRQEDALKAEGGRMKDELKAEGGRRKDEQGELQPSALSPQPFNIKVPPKYTSADFLKTDFWRLRGKLDVPKERWISYPHCETESDPSLVVGWAGWNHLQQATALIAYYDARKREGWDANRLTPLLAGLDQLLPWIHQWHPEVDPEFGETAGQSYETLLKADAHELGLTLEQIRAWEPVKKGGRRKAEGGSKPRKARMTRKKNAEAETEAEE